MPTYGVALLATSGVNATRVVREPLSANRTYYVRTDGNDSNTGLADSAGGAFLTWAKALAVYKTLDFSGFTVTVSLGTGTWTASMTVHPWVGGGNLVITGAGAASTIVSTAANCFNVTGGLLPGEVQFRSMKLTSSSGICIAHDAVGTVLIDTGMEFGAAGGLSQLRAFANFSRIYFARSSTGYTISGGAPYHMVADMGATIYCDNNVTITITGSPVFANAFLIVTNSARFYTAGTITYSGSVGATTPRYSVTANGVINTQGGGANYFPGTTAGTSATGGQYL